eukprot:TRINITY_DN25627_c0_g1_i2.p1 TRINITY_DN25627_c0_g1~~TRINITY_DN25627_c0_g1_i2.p1  ORF type:complete len:278 (-),score=32.43 TRINITY_DN25627_c0_g1_i2:85-891(-)
MAGPPLEPPPPPVLLTHVGDAEAQKSKAISRLPRQLCKDSFERAQQPCGCCWSILFAGLHADSLAHEPFADAEWSSDLLCSFDVTADQKEPFITNGYRPPPKGLCDLLKTIFTLHNETGNIWTHLLGFAFAVQQGLSLGLERLSSEVWWVLALVFATAFCMICSVVYHLCRCASRHCVRETSHRMDKIGIVVLISMSYFSSIALGYRCYPGLRVTYLVFSAAVTAALAVPLVRPRLIQDTARYWIALVAIGVIPGFHFIAIAPQGCVL